MPGQPHLAHSAGAQGFDETVAANRHPFVEQLFVDLEHRALGEEHGTLEHRAKLANVSRPHVRLEPLHRLRGYTVNHLAELPRVPAHEVINQHRDVVTPIDQRGERDPVLEQQAHDRIEPAVCASRVGSREVEAITRTPGTGDAGLTRERSISLEHLLKRGLRLDGSSCTASRNSVPPTASSNLSASGSSEPAPGGVGRMMRAKLGTAHVDERALCGGTPHAARAPQRPLLPREDLSDSSGSVRGASRAMASRSARTATLSPSSGPSTRLRASLRSS